MLHVFVLFSAEQHSVFTNCLVNDRRLLHGIQRALVLSLNLWLFLGTVFLTQLRVQIINIIISFICCSNLLLMCQWRMFKLSFFRWGLLFVLHVCHWIYLDWCWSVDMTPFPVGYFALQWLCKVAVYLWCTCFTCQSLHCNWTATSHWVLK